MAYREVRVRPVVRYIVTEYSAADGSGGTSIEFGEFDNADRASVIAHLLANDGPTRSGDTPATVVDCPKLKITQNAIGAWKIIEGGALT